MIKDIRSGRILKRIILTTARPEQTVIDVFGGCGGPAGPTGGSFAGPTGAQGPTGSWGPTGPNGSAPAHLIHWAMFSLVDEGDVFYIQIPFGGTTMVYSTNYNDSGDFIAYEGDSIYVRALASDAYSYGVQPGIYIYSDNGYIYDTGYVSGEADTSFSPDYTMSYDIYVQGYYDVP